MTVRELITRLQECDPDLPVCLADWGEQYAEPNEAVAEVVFEGEHRYYNKKRALVQGKCVIIGDLL